MDEATRSHLHLCDLDKLLSLSEPWVSHLSNGHGNENLLHALDVQSKPDILNKYLGCFMGTDIQK